MELSFEPIIERIPLLMQGLGLTLALTSIAFVVGTVGGLPIAVLRITSGRIVRSPITVLVEATLSTPVPLHLFLVFFGLVNAFDITLSAFHSILLVLIWNQAVVMSENYRSGLQSVPEGLTRAATVLGLQKRDQYRFIILPLAFRAILPPMTSSTVNLIKESSLAGFIGAMDLLNAGMLGATVSFRPVEFYTTVAFLYFVISYPIVKLGDRLERGMDASRAV